MSAVPIDIVIARRITHFDAGRLHATTRRRRTRLRPATVLPWDTPWTDDQERHQFSAACYQRGPVYAPQPSTDPPPAPPRPRPEPLGSAWRTLTRIAELRSVKTGIEYPWWWMNDLAWRMTWCPDNIIVKYVAERFDAFEKAALGEEG